jgi:hypothetical protein
MCQYISCAVVEMSTTCKWHWTGDIEATLSTVAAIENW